jgi:hypothetical protein
MCLNVSELFAEDKGMGRRQRLINNSVTRKGEREQEDVDRKMALNHDGGRDR